jgi:hypothetical protein
MSKLDPVISSHTREEQEKAQKEIADREKAIEDSNKNEFGDELIELKKSVSDAKFIEKVLTGNPMADIIVREWRNGSQAMSHKLLLREAKLYLSKQTETKKQRSFPADIGAGDTQRRVDKADSIEDAFEIADRENS